MEHKFGENLHNWILAMKKEGKTNLHIGTTIHSYLDKYFETRYRFAIILDRIRFRRQTQLKRLQRECRIERQYSQENSMLTDLGK